MNRNGKIFHQWFPVSILPPGIVAIRGIREKIWVWIIQWVPGIRFMAEMSFFLPQVYFQDVNKGIAVISVSDLSGFFSFNPAGHGYFSAIMKNFRIQKILMKKKKSTLRSIKINRLTHAAGFSLINFKP